VVETWVWRGREQFSVVRWSSVWQCEPKGASAMWQTKWSVKRNFVTQTVSASFWRERKTGSNSHCWTWNLFKVAQSATSVISRLHVGPVRD
jgi:hypothetical protein